MNFIKKIGIFLCLTLVFSACGSKIDSELVQVETVLPENSVAVFLFDYSKSDQIKNLNHFLDSIPETDFRAFLKNSYNGFFGEDMDFDKALMPFLAKKWSFAIGVDFDGSLNSMADLSKFEDEIDIYLVGKFEAADEFELFLLKLLDENLDSKLVSTQDGDIKYWTSVKDDTFLARYGDLFFVTNTEESRVAAVKRLKNLGGFNLENKLGKVKELNDNKLAYFYFDFQRILGVFKDYYHSMDIDFMDSYLGIGDAYMSLSVDDQGSKVLVLLDDYSSTYDGIILDEDLKLVDLVPGKGVFSYFENLNFSVFLESSFNNFSSFALSNPDLFNQMTGVGDENSDLYDLLLAKYSKFLPIEKDEFKSIIDSPIAFSFADIGDLFPAISIYLQLEESELEVSKKLLNVFDSYIDNFLVVINEEIDSEIDVKNLIKKDKVDGYFRVYLDKTLFVGLVLEELEEEFGYDFSEMELEFYYGITDDNVLTMGFYPNFVDEYGTEFMSSNSNYAKAIGKLGFDPASVFYFNLSDILSYIDRIIEIFKDTETFTEGDLLAYNMVREYLDLIDYFVVSERLDGDVLKSVFYMGFGK